MGKLLVVGTITVFLVVALAGNADAKTCKSKSVKAIVGGIGAVPSDAIQLWHTKVLAKYGPAYSHFGNARKRSAKCKTVSGSGFPVRKCTAKGRPCKN
jgi:hypothetical protein